MFSAAKGFYILFLVSVICSSNVCFGARCFPPFSFDCKCDKGSKDGCNFIFNSVKDINDQNDWNAFFYPKIRVRDSGGCYISRKTTATMGVGDCRYVCPQNIVVRKEMCDPPTDENSTKVNLNKDGGSVRCICAFRVTSCSDESLNLNNAFNNTLGCFLLPIGPPPPPCCNNAADPSPHPTMVPVRDASYLEPSIKVRVGIDVKRRCANGDEVGISESCIGGSTREIFSYDDQIIRSGESATLNYNGAGYSFSASVEAGAICGTYVGLPSETKQCYELMPMAEPVIHASGDDYMTLSLEDYNSGQRFSIQENQVNDVTGLSLIRPYVNEKRQLEYGEEGVIKEDPNGNVICVYNSKNPVNDYSILRNGKLLRLKEKGQVFEPVKYSSNIGIFVADNASNRNSINILDTDQHVLDTIILNMDGTISIRPNMGARELFKYQALPSESGDSTTVYVDLKGGKPVFLTDQERSSLVNTNPYHQGLCRPEQFYHFNYQRAAAEHYYTVDFVADKCDFIDIEAWGGGSASTSMKNGSSGGYTKGTVHLKTGDSKKTFKMKIGRGDDVLEKDTVVSLCEDDRSNCERVLDAKGSSDADRGAPVGYWHNTLFDIEAFEGGAGAVPQLSKISVPLQLPIPEIGGVAYPQVQDGHYMMLADICDASGSKIIKIPGSGGCPGGIGEDGFVRLTCQQWKK